MKILGIKIDNVNLAEAVKLTEKFLNDGQKHYIVTPNPEFLVAAQKDEEFRRILNGADLAIPDGVGLVWASRFLGGGLKERVAGTDLVEALCQLAAEKGYKVGFLGAKEGIAEKASRVLKEKYPGLKVVFVYGGSQKLHPHLGGERVIDFLFVAYGQVKQEKWIARNLPKIPVKVAIGVGGAFDYLSGAVPRAPKWLQNLGLEWLYRLICQPWRLKRQSALLKFILLLFPQVFAKLRFPGFGAKV